MDVLILSGGRHIPIPSHLGVFALNELEAFSSVSF